MSCLVAPWRGSKDEVLKVTKRFDSFDKSCFDYIVSFYTGLGIFSENLHVGSRLPDGRFYIVSNRIGDNIVSPFVVGTIYFE